MGIYFNPQNASFAKDRNDKLYVDKTGLLEYLNSNDENLVHKYLQFLHSLFKSEESKSFLALAYITGILPIKKIKDESALNNLGNIPC